MPAGAQHLIDTTGSPPPAALAATALAAVIVRELYDSGRELRFTLPSGDGRVTVLLCDAEGAVVTRLTPSEALAIAAGDLVPAIH